MNKFEWTFGSGNYIDIKRVTDVSSCVHFSYDDKLRINVAWTVESFTEGEWDCILACVRQAKTILKRLKRI